MNSITSTYPHALTRTGHDAGLLGSIGAALRRLAQPTKAAVAARDPVREAAAVRAMADEVRNSDPDFAADLYAAADRHEQLYAAEMPR